MIVYAENGVGRLSGTISASDIDVITDVAGFSPSVAAQLHIC